jgi:hypothetical protein
MEELAMLSVYSSTAVGADVSRFQAIARGPRLTDQSDAPKQSNALRAAATLLQSVLATPDTSNDLDVVA